MATGARRQPLTAQRGGASAGLTAMLAAAAVGGGLYFVATHRPEPRPVVKDDPLPQVAALARAEKDAEWLQRAIRERRAILGMTFREVEMAKGNPQLKHRGDDLPEMHRAKGGVEIWIYDVGNSENSSVVFGANGRVIHSSDVGDKPGPGHAIRQ